MKHFTVLLTIIFLVIISTPQIQAQNIINSCSQPFMDVGGELENYLNSENSSWLICPDSTEYLTIEFTHVDIEVAIDAGVDSTGCMDVLYIYDGVDAKSPLRGAYCGQESSDGQSSFISGHTLEVGDSFVSTDSTGCFFMKFESDTDNTRSGWYAEITCCERSLASDISDGVDFPVANNFGAFINLSIDNSCIRDGQLSNISDFVPAGTSTSCFTEGVSLPNQSYYVFQSNILGGFVQLEVDSVDSVGEIQMAVLGPVTLDNGIYTGGVINDCVTGVDPFPSFFNAGPNQTYILITATENPGRISVITNEFSVGLGGALPIKLGEYGLTKNEKSVTIQWNTESETNNSHFEIFKSTDGDKFELIGEVHAKNRPSEYTFDDMKPAVGLNYYFMRQIDQDGSAESFKVLTTEFFTKEYIVFPNPSNGVIYIAGPEDEIIDRVNVYDNQGQMVESLNTNGSIDLQHLSNGLYYLEIQGQGNQTMKRVMIND